MSASARSLKNGQIILKDDGAAATITVTLEEGDLAWEETKNYDFIKDRQILDHIREGEEVPVSLSFSVQFAGFASGNVASGSVSLYEAIKNVGGANGVWVSTQVLISEVWSLDIDFLCNDPVPGGALDDTVVFTNVVFGRVRFEEGTPTNILQVEAEALMTAPTITSA